MERAPLFNDVSWTVKTFYSQPFSSCCAIQSSANRSCEGTVWGHGVVVFAVPAVEYPRGHRHSDPSVKGDLKQRRMLAWNQTTCRYIFPLAGFSRLFIQCEYFSASNFSSQGVLLFRSFKWRAEGSCLMTCLLHMPALFMTSKIQTAGYKMDALTVVFLRFWYFESCLLDWHDFIFPSPLEISIRQGDMCHEQ